MVKTI